MNRTHSENNKYKCTQCEYWGIKQDIKLHIKHRYDPPPQCKKCPHVASGKHYLGYHMKNKHEDMKRFECT